MPPSVLTRAQYAQVFLTAFGAALKKTLNVQDGKFTKATAESVGACGTILQNMSQYTIAVSRAETSTGADLDSFLAQFGYTRNPAIYAFGTVTFSSAIPATSVVKIPIGTVVQTQGGLIRYTVIADPSQPTYDVFSSSYVLQIGQSSLTATVQAQQPGSASNVQAGDLHFMVPTILGISAVTNNGAIISGVAGESDADFLKRFQEDFANKAEATFDAITNALKKLGCRKVKLISGCKVVGNPATGLLETPDGGWVNAVIDDGSGYPTDSFMDACRKEVARVMAFGFLGPIVVRPEILTGTHFNIQINVAFLNPQSQNAITLAVKTAIVNYVNNLPIGGLFDDRFTGPVINIGDLIAVAKNSHPEITRVDENACLINGRNSDFVYQPWQEVLIGVTNVSVGVI